jgi:hypothetical protein
MNHHHETIVLAEHHRAELLADADRVRRGRRSRRTGGATVRSWLHRARGD